jgi:2-oxo-3-hexenedioate decarboxylase
VSDDQRIGLAITGTSATERSARGIGAPFATWLSRSMRLPTDASIPISEFVSPIVTPQLCFMIETRLVGSAVGVSDVLGATRSVCGALVVSDSAADDTPVARFALGTRALSPMTFDLALIGVLLQDFGDVVETGAGAAVLGHPAEAIAQIAVQLTARGESVDPGMLVLTGAVTAPVPLTVGSRLAVTFAHLGRVSLPVLPSTREAT